VLAAALQSNAAVQKKRGPASAPGRELALRERQGLRWLGLFASFVAKTKEVAAAAMSETKYV
jgi:hypothetical protein